ncbi:7TM-DISM domain-containing protein [Indibacter alkaliphilus]|nr:7TM-DISM domain-containing protein [Indibacter alkaliphilus]
MILLSLRIFILLFLSTFSSWMVDEKQQRVQELPTVIKLAEDSIHYHITESLDFFLDIEGLLDIEEVSASTFSHNFQKATNPYMDSTNAEGVLWLRVTVENQRPELNEAWFFESWGFDIRNIVFYMPNDDNTFSVKESGYTLPFQEREIRHKNFNQVVNIRPGETKTFYLRIQRSYLMGFSFHLRSHSSFIPHAVNEYFLLGIYYGVLVIVLFFTIYLIFKQKDPLYAYFAFFLYACIWYSLGRDGLGFQYLWPNFPELNILTRRLLTQLLLVISALLFSNYFVQKIHKSPAINKVTWGAILLIVLLTLNQEYGFKVGDFYMLLIFSSILLVPIVGMVRTLVKIRQMSWAHSFALICMFIGLLQSYASEANVELFDDPIINWYFANPVIFAEVIFFSISIFNQIGYLQKKSFIAERSLNRALLEKNELQDKLNSNLKDLVKKRTQKVRSLANELAEKNRQLLRANTKLKKLNEEVRTENLNLNLTNQELKEGLEKTIQEMVLMKGFDFREFKEIFPDKEACCKFLSELKWAGGFHCKKCGYNKATISKSFGRRCRNCNYNESATSNTLFHKIKFPIEKAFYMLYLSNRKDVNMTLNELSETIDLRRETCWAFKNKIAIAKEQIDFDGELNGWERLALVDLEGNSEA